MQFLDPLTIPLQGRQLIEASAGTGKTYSIVLLYLRLLLEQQLGVDRILVVTFTNAATEELRSRIRGRIREALDVLEGRSRGDSLLQKLIKQREKSTDQSRQILTDALTCMDEAAVYTIHSFCQRMLQDHAFESGVPFAIEFLESELPLRHQIIEDFWRQRFYPASAAEAAWAAQEWTDPAGLLRTLQGPLLNRMALPAVTVDDKTLDTMRRRVAQLFAQLCSAWPTARNEVQQILEEDPCLSRARKNYRKNDQVPAILEAMDRFTAAQEPTWNPPQCLALLATSVMATHLLKKCQAPPRHAVFDLFDALYRDLRQLVTDSRIHVLLAAREYLFAELDRRKEEQARMYFDDLLISLDNALAGRDGETFALRIRERFPVALIDEFQDTDPMQYRIFRRIFPSGRGGLLMIGDPKQAIYSFRGADIFTYIRARRETPAAARFTMDTNYRSSAAMIRAVNRLFSVPDSFIFSKDIEFTPVKENAAKEPPLLRLNEAVPPPLHCLYLEASGLAARPGHPVAKEQAMTAAARLSAREIARLLMLAAEGRATLGDTPLHAGDITVLVRTHHEADCMQQALRTLRIRSVYCSRDSVFASREALQMQWLLAALAALDDEPLVRNVLLSDLFGLSVPDLEQLDGNEQEWEQILRVLRDYRQCLREHGFTPMFQSLLTERCLVSRLSAQQHGERSLTNFLHLAELLQEAALNQTGIDGLLHWLNRQISNPDQDADSQQLRMESDEDLVRIITIHKAKGLEFPVAFVPFCWSGRIPDPRRPFSFHRPGDLQLMVDPGGGDDSNLEPARQEQLAEDLRLFYVAMTRACCCCYFCWGRISKMETSAPAWLLHRDEENTVRTTDDHQIRHDLLALNKDGELLRIHDHNFADGQAGPAVDRKQSVPEPARFHGRIDTGWRITSYSQLAAGPHAAPPPCSGQETTQTTPVLTPFTFPRGAAAGTCLHAILERIDFSDPSPDSLLIPVQEQLKKAGFDSAWQSVVCAWMHAVLETELAPGIRLRLLPERDVRTEMDFHFPLAGLDLRRFNRVLADFGSRPLPKESGILNGLMKGFIDLVFRFGNRFYLADYKSNYLGPQPTDYCQPNLQRAMQEHRYDLQYLIYTLALHRFLAVRLPGYDFDRHFGGILYLFLRGMHPDHTAGTGIHVCRPQRQLIEKLDRCCRGEEER